MSPETYAEEEARARRRAGNYFSIALTVGTVALMVYTESPAAATVFAAGGIGILSVVNSLHARLTAISQRLDSIESKIGQIGEKHFGTQD
jgi:hypothetical protein